MLTQTRALTKITASTWGASFARTRHVYPAVHRTATTFESTVWHAPSRTKDAKKKVCGKLQNRCLRIVAGAYKATPVEVPRAENMISPMKELRKGEKRSLKLGSTRMAEGPNKQSGELALCHDRVCGSSLGSNFVRPTVLVSRIESSV